MYRSPQMSVMITMAESGTYCPSAGCVAECDNAAVTIIIEKKVR